MKKSILKSIIASVLFIAFIVSCSSSEDAATTTPTPSLPVLTTASATAVTQTSATSGGNITADGGKTITARGICWATTENPTTSGSKTTETGTTGVFSSNLTSLTANTLYYVRAYATNSDGTAYGNQISFTTGSIPATLPLLSTTAATAISFTTATTGGNVTSDGGGAITARGVCYATTSNPTITNSLTTETGTIGIFASNLSSLSSGTTYYVRAYATNSAGTGYGNEITFSTSSNGPTGGNAICNGSQPTAVVPITSSTGKIWMDRNLGASRAATALNDYQAYGCLYQWGRGNDGHASMNWTMGQDDAWNNPAGTPVNGSTSTKSTSDTPPNALFITSSSGYYDWRNPKNDNLWQGVNGINNPCPAGYRIPTHVELKAEITAYSINGATNAINSIHKFPFAGIRGFDNNVLSNQGSLNFYWTSTVSLGHSYTINMNGSGVYSNSSSGRSGGYSVRCIKD